LVWQAVKGWQSRGARDQSAVNFSHWYPRILLVALLFVWKKYRIATDTDSCETGLGKLLLRKCVVPARNGELAAKDNMSRPQCGGAS
jgi:hypothetical protein